MATDPNCVALWEERDLKKISISDRVKHQASTSRRVLADWLKPSVTIWTHPRNDPTGVLATETMYTGGRLAMMR